jgi:hypothetical protein
MPRQRVFPQGTTASERVEASLKNLRAQGGARKTFRLKPEANAALAKLQRLIDAKTETEAVEVAIITMCESLQNAVDAVTSAAKKSHAVKLKTLVATNKTSDVE